jgi:ammonia channel protein AmtB
MRVVGALIGNRVRPEDEEGGLDVPEMGIEGYAVEAGGIE